LDLKYKEAIYDYISDHVTKKVLYLLGLITDTKKWKSRAAIHLQIVDRMDTTSKDDGKRN
jgi:hypothetical protein